MDPSSKKQPNFGSIDGFGRVPQRNKNNLRSFDNYYGQASQNSARVAKIDGFSGKDGFQSAGQTPITAPASLKPTEVSQFNSAEPIGANPSSAPKATKKERRKFFKKKDKKSHGLKPAGKHRKLKLGLKISGFLLFILLFAFGGLALKAYLKTKHIFKGGGNAAAALDKNVDPTKLNGEGDGRVNILLLGKGGPGHDGPDLTDTILVASIDPVAKEVALLSLPRDLWVKTANVGQTKINAVYALNKYALLDKYTLKQQTDSVKKQAEDAGIKAIEGKVSEVLGIPIHYYGMIDFVGFREAIDSVGGIDIDVKTRVYDTFIMADNNNNPLIAEVGQQHFDGKRALLYAQSRHGSARGDFDRNERQREVIIALKNKVLNLGTFANPLKVNQLLNSFGDRISTSFTLSELMRVYEITKTVESTNIKSIGLVDPPNSFLTTGAVNNQSVVLPTAGMFAYSDIQSFVRNTLRDSFLKSENASVVVLNGSETIGLATKTSNELKSYGYNVTKVGDAPTSTYTKTILVDLTKGVKKYTKNYLEKRLNTTAVTSLPDPNINPGTAEFVIIVGSDQAL